MAHFDRVTTKRLKKLEELLASGISPWNQNGFVPNNLHRMAARTGAFPPALAHYLISNFSRPGDIVLDLFSGKGTTLLEAILLGRRALGCDISEEAFILSKAKAKPVPKKQVNNYIRSKKYFLQRETRKIALSAIPSKVTQFYHPSTLKQLVACFNIFEFDRNNGNTMEKRFAYHALGCLIGILHGPSDLFLSLPCSHAYSMSPNYVRRYVAEHLEASPGSKKFVPQERDVIARLLRKSHQTALNSDRVRHITTRGSDAYWSDALQFDPYGNRSNTVDLVVTSPPYMRAQTYPWDNWLRLWFLGHDYQNVQSEMYLITSSVEKYREGMRNVFAKMFTLLKPGALAFVIVGDVKKRHQKDRKFLHKIINLGEHLGDEAGSVGFSVLKMLSDPIPRTRRSTFTFHSGEAGTLLDRILCLRKPLSRLR